MNDRIYVCHTYYHAYVTCLKELNLRREKQEAGEDPGSATLVLSTMSNDFGNLPERAEKSGLFEAVFRYDEKPVEFFPELMPLRTNTGNLVQNMKNRMKLLKELARLETPFVPVDFRKYRDIYVFCDSDPVGYYLAGSKIRYHAVEDGLDCLRYYDTARYDNRGHFGFKAWMAARGLIFIQNGWSKYCIDMEVNSIAALQFPGPKGKMKELSREKLVQGLSAEDRALLVAMFLENREQLLFQVAAAHADGRPVMLVLSEPLLPDLADRKKLFETLIRENETMNGKKASVVIKPHPRDKLDYRKEFPQYVILDPKFPMEILNLVDGVCFDRVVTVFTVPDSLHCVKEKIYLGKDFMDRFEAPEIHRQNEAVAASNAR